MLWKITQNSKIYINVCVDFGLNSVKLYAGKTEMKGIIETELQVSFPPPPYKLCLILIF